MPISKIISGALSLLVPRACVHCGGPLEESAVFVCYTCLSSLQAATPNACPHCGAWLDEDGFCHDCQAQDWHYKQAVGAFVYQQAFKSVIQALKYQQLEGLAAWLAKLCTPTLQQQKFYPLLQAIVPVPLTPARRRQRGFNQAASLAQQFARLTGLSFYPHALKRKLAATPQAHLTAAQRRANVAGVYAPGRQAGQIQGKTVLLIDDIATTGSTLNACAAALKQAGAQQVYCFTCGRA